MTGYHVAYDIRRLVDREAGAAHPNAATQEESVRAAHGARFGTPRLQLTILLRRLADALEPAPLASAPGAERHQGC